MKHYDMKLSGATLGYCEVKPFDSHNDIDSLCTDLIRLAIFSRNIMLRNENKIACAVQAVGTHCSFYVLSSLCDGITIMNEVLSWEVPAEIKELKNLNNIVHELKQISRIHEDNCLKRYVTDVEDEEVDLTTILKPKRRKRGADAVPITFN